MIRRILSYAVFICLSGGIIPAQEVVTGLPSNILLKREASSNPVRHARALLAPAELPFFDDFSGHSYYPDSTRWTDDYVFINNTFSDNQITKGIATFDALDARGRLYDIASPYTFEADKLTSQPVNLNYAPGNNIRISFFYQAGGLGDEPEPEDSLTLQFFAPEEDEWYSVWRVKGTAEKSFNPVIIEISDPRFLKSGFRFRFTNYASLSSNQNDPAMIGNCDLWNLDYVLIDKNRSAGDTIFHDVALTLPVRSLLKNHEAMPWKQFKEVELQEMGSSILIHYRNNDTIIRNVTRNFEIWNVYGNSLAYAFSAGASNIDPLSNVDYYANLVYTFSSTNPDSALFRVTSSLKTDQFDPKQNDTIIYYQVFSNYFAYDDGTAEAGYGINGLGSRNAMFAYRFTSYTDDTLRAISICFNDSYNNSNKRSFDLMVWDDNNGLPGNILYTLEEVMVEQGEQNNGFYMYRIPDEVAIKGIFYIGWRQRSETFLNAGLDVNTPHGGRQFYWLNGLWQESQVAGTVMIHPVTGKPLRITSVSEIPDNTGKRIMIWPNPSSGFITVDAGDLLLSGDGNIRIMDLYGREVRRAILTERIDISGLPAGAYIIVVCRGKSMVGYGRLIKTR